MSAIRLVDAWLCVNDGCDTIHDNQRRCPVCGSEAQPFRIARVILPMPRESVLPERPAQGEVAGAPV